MMSKQKWVAIYPRLSVAGKTNQINMEVQTERCLDRAAELYPGIPVKVYDGDEGFSIAKDDAPPAFLRMLDDVQAGKVCAIVASELERLDRGQDHGRAFELSCLEAGITQYDTLSGEAIELDSFKLDISRAVAKDEVRKIQRRQRNKARAKAERGDAPPGKPPWPYSREDKQLTVIPDRADALKMVAKMFLSGKGLAECCRWLESEGYGKWRINRLKTLLASPTIAGLRVHSCKECGVKHDAWDGPRPGSWEPVLDRDVWERIQRKLNQGNGRGAPGKPRPTHGQYLLKGIIRCEPCGSSMYGNGGQSKTIYRCPDCNSSINGHEVEKFALLVVLPHLAELTDQLGLGDERAERRAERRAELQGQLDALSERRDTVLTALLDDGDVTAYRTARHGLAERESAIQAEWDALPTPETVVSPAALQESWQGMTTRDRGRVLARFIDRMVIAPHVGAKRFRPERATIVLKESEAQEALPELRDGRKAHKARLPNRIDYKALLAGGDDDQDDTDDLNKLYATSIDGKWELWDGQLIPGPASVSR